jgi:hypothetical protein
LAELKAQALCRVGKETAEMLRRLARTVSGIREWKAEWESDNDRYATTAFYKNPQLDC